MRSKFRAMEQLSSRTIETIARLQSIALLSIVLSGDTIGSFKELNNYIFGACHQIHIYFADPYSSWQRGSNENVNMLLRGYLPKRYDIRGLTQEELDDIAEELNSRPRKRLGYYTPNEIDDKLKKGGSVALAIRM